MPYTASGDRDNTQKIVRGSGWYLRKNDGHIRSRGIERIAIIPVLRQYMYGMNSLVQILAPII